MAVKIEQKVMGNMGADIRVILKSSLKTIHLQLIGEGKNGVFLGYFFLDKRGAEKN